MLHVTNVLHFYIRKGFLLLLFFFFFEKNDIPVSYPKQQNVLLYTVFILLNAMTKNASTSAIHNIMTRPTADDEDDSAGDSNEEQQLSRSTSRTTTRRMFHKVHSSNTFLQVPQSEDAAVGLPPLPSTALETATPPASPDLHSNTSSNIAHPKSIPEQMPRTQPAPEAAHHTTAYDSSSASPTYPAITEEDTHQSWLETEPNFPDATDDDIILSLISNSLFLWGALFVLVISLWDLTDLKRQSDLPLVLFDDNTQPSHLKANMAIYNTASLLGPIFYFLNAIFDYLWALFVKEKTSLYAQYLGRMDPLWDILYGIFFGLGAVMDIMNASLSISIGRGGGSKDDFDSFFTVFAIMSTFFYLVSGLFFLFAVEFTTCKHPIKMIILLGDCLFLAGSAMDFCLSLISDPDIVIEDEISIAHGHILSNSFWTINAALYLIADIVVWCTQRKTHLDPVDELVSIVMKDLTLDRRGSSRSRLSSSHRRMSTAALGDGGGSHEIARRRATVATLDDVLPTRSRMSTWDIFMSRPISPPGGQNSPIGTEEGPFESSSRTKSWGLFLSRPRFRRATMGTIDDIHELELTETPDALRGTMT